MMVSQRDDDIGRMVSQRVSGLFAALETFGARSFGYALFAPFGSKVDPISGIVSYGVDPEWRELYKNLEFRSTDPLLSAAHHSTSLVGWHRQLYEMPLTDEQRQFRLKHEELHVGDGISFSINGANGFSAIAFCSLDSKAFVDQWSKVEHIKCLAQSCHDLIVQTFVQGRQRAIGLSERETQVLSSIVGGENNRQIARKLRISRATADTYVQRIYSKLGVSGRVNATREALKWGLVAI